MQEYLWRNHVQADHSVSVPDAGGYIYGNDVPRVKVLIWNISTTFEAEQVVLQVRILNFGALVSSAPEIDDTVPTGDCKPIPLIDVGIQFWWDRISVREKTHLL